MTRVIMLVSLMIRGARRGRIQRLMTCWVTDMG